MITNFRETWEFQYELSLSLANMPPEAMSENIETVIPETPMKCYLASLYLIELGQWKTPPLSYPDCLRCKHTTTLKIFIMPPPTIPREEESNLGTTDSLWGLSKPDMSPSHPQIT